MGCGSDRAPVPAPGGVLGVEFVPDPTEVSVSEAGSSSRGGALFSPISSPSVLNEGSPMASLFTAGLSLVSLEHAAIKKQIRRGRSAVEFRIGIVLLERT